METEMVIKILSVIVMAAIMILIAHKYYQNHKNAGEKIDGDLEIILKDKAKKFMDNYLPILMPISVIERSVIEEADINKNGYYVTLYLCTSENEKPLNYWARIFVMNTGSGYITEMKDNNISDLYID